VETKDGIKSFRDRLRLNQAELAEKLGIVQGNITAWESGRGTPSFQISKKLLKLGITVEELFGVRYNEMHYLAVWKVFPEGSGVATRTTQKKLNDFEAHLLREMLDEFAGFDVKLESFKKLIEIYKLEREIERGDNATDLTAKKQRLQELQGQIEDEFILSNMFAAKNEIKTLEKELEQMENAAFLKSVEELNIRQRIQDLQQQIEKEMYSYVYSELKKLAKQEPTNEKIRKIRKFWLEQELRRLREQMRQNYDAVEQKYDAVELDAIKEQINELEKELADLESGG
jgi:DNA-binding XRE family transcriptional regulator/HAMP domain-containing protein